ncbi:MAG: SPFH/Band 7/PHB domain protein [Thermoplasmata archaeon]|nr:SPFH/Band 7/PHB domain protein [Thermoplasmata archaeon]
MDISTIIGLVILIIFAIIFILMTSVRIIQPYEQGLLVVLGNFRRILNPGFNMVPPLISEVIKLDLRTQVMDVPRQEVITKDNSPTNVDAIIYIKVIDPKKAFFEVDNYRTATIYLGQTTLRSLIGNMELDEVLYSRDTINDHLRDILDKATDQWGVKVEAVEIREVDPVGPVKAAMEEQTSAERRRRAAILTADGEKRSAILVAEGDKRSRILQAEGVRQSKILEAEGQRVATILEGQGEAQRLRILSMGALPLDHKALTVLSLEALKKMADGQATKIIFPFEISRLLEGAASYLGVSQDTPERTATSAQELEAMLGKAEDILGDIPSQSALKAELKTIEKEMEIEAKDTEELAESLQKGKKDPTQGQLLRTKVAQKKKAEEL